MASLNKAQVIGNLGNDPEVRFTPKGTQVARVSVATTDGWKDETGERQERTEWHRIVFYGALAEVAAKYLKKGSQVFVEGKLRTRRWDDKDGVTRYSTEIVGTELQMLGKKPADAGAQAAPAEPPLGGPGADPDEDVPF